MKKAKIYVQLSKLKTQCLSDRLIGQGMLKIRGLNRASMAKRVLKVHDFFF